MIKDSTVNQYQHVIFIVDFLISDEFHQQAN